MGFLGKFIKAVASPITSIANEVVGAASDAVSAVSDGGGSSSSSQGNSSSLAKSSADSFSHSSSWGNRDVASTMIQNINDSTHQHAHSVRSRRASVVKEVSQSEHESISTRVLTNYNHMHALTVQYYEVLQIYRVETKLTRAEKCIYIPFKLYDFNDPGTLEKYKPTLSKDPFIRKQLDLLGDDLTVDLHVPPLETDPGPVTKPAGWEDPGWGQISINPETPVGRPGELGEKMDTTKPGLDTTKPGIDKTQKELLQLKQFLYNRQNVSADKRWNTREVSRMALVLGKPVVRANSPVLSLPSDAKIVAVGIQSASDKVGFALKSKSGEVISNLTAPVPLAELDEMTLSYSGADDQAVADVQLILEKDGQRFPVTLKSYKMAKGQVSTQVVHTQTPAAKKTPANIQNILQNERLYYTQLILRSIGSHGIHSMLSKYHITIEGKKVPLVEVIDPNLIGFIGNYGVFKMATSQHAATALEKEDAWTTFKKDKGIQVGLTKQEIVPLSSGGVFAEAVLGRYNSAEKLDITRFWNWQDSPIPIQAPEIAAIQSGSRAMPEDVKPGNLSTPIVNITQPTSLPEPTGTAAILSAIQNGNMFRDMSGLADTIKASTQAIQATAQGATAAGQQAGANMATHLQAEVEKMRIAAQLLSSLASSAVGLVTGKGGGGVVGSGNPISNDGAKINYYDKMTGGDQRNQSGSPGSAPSPPANGGDSGSPDSGSPAGPSDDFGGVPADHPLQAATWGAAGQPYGQLAKGIVAASYSTDTDAQDAATGSGSGTATSSGIQTFMNGFAAAAGSDNEDLVNNGQFALKVRVLNILISQLLTDFTALPFNASPASLTAQENVKQAIDSLKKVIVDKFGYSSSASNAVAIGEELKKATAEVDKRLAEVKDTQQFTQAEKDKIEKMRKFLHFNPGFFDEKNGMAIFDIFWGLLVKNAAGPAKDALGNADVRLNIPTLQQYFNMCRAEYPGCHKTAGNMIRFFKNRGRFAKLQPLKQPKFNIGPIKMMVKNNSQGPLFTVLEYEMDPALNAQYRKQLEEQLAAGYMIKAGVVSGTDSEQGIAIPDHFILIIGFEKGTNTFLFWDPAVGDSMGVGDGMLEVKPCFGLLFFTDKLLSTAKDAENLKVDDNGDHFVKGQKAKAGDSTQHRYQVTHLLTQP